MRRILRVQTVICVTLITLFAQTPPAFDVVSVKPAVGGPIKVQSDPGRLSINSVTLEVLILMAYGLREYQYEGPAWLHTTRYDIMATTSSPQLRPVELAMLRSVLVERFKLAIHHDTKTIPVFALVVGKNGSKLKPMDDSLPAPFEMYSNFSMDIQGGATTLRGYGSLGQLSDFLGRVAGRPVVDRTGISGNFDLKLLCAIDGFPGFETSPSVFDALQSQMGLRLEPRTMPIEITVVDHVEKPTAN